jgi:hypothetical protein
MQKNRWIIIAAAAVVILVGAFWIMRRGGESPSAVDLIDQFPSADKRSPLPVSEAFSVTDVTIDNQKKRAIFMRPTSRLIYRVNVPNDGWLRTALALKPEAWSQEGDGVLFRIGVSDGRKYDELLNQHVNPFGVQGDRRWIPIVVDLSAYGGENVELIFNTNTSVPGKGDDPRGDLAVWAEPQIYVHR